ncbi:MAG: FAD-dependent oxidoreductase [Acidimicrobiia bacterium]|nr:FAD-dependent oxidoreductase [Acidimicrobiia bacterium]
MASSGNGWDHEVDVLVVGSGAAALAAAVTSNARGLDTLVVEKTRAFGGTTAYSGGGLWIPDNPVLRREGMADTHEEGRTYLDAVLALHDDDVSPERREAFLTEGPKAVELLERECPALRFDWVRGYPDYHPELPGGKSEGRQIQARPVDGRVLGDELASLRQIRPVYPQPFGMWIRIDEARDLPRIGRSWRVRGLVARLVARALVAKVQGKKMVRTGGQMLVAGLRAGLRDKQVPLWLRTPVVELCTDEDGAVTGAVVEREGRPRRVRARSGVILGAGGFERNEEMRHRYQQEPITNRWTLGASGNTGDLIRAGAALGAELGLMEDSWWVPGLLDPDGRCVFVLAERQLPGGIIVNGDGERYANESMPYVNLGHAMYEGQARGVTHVPSWMVIDARFRRRYVFGPFLPRQPVAKAWFESGVAVRADTIGELAGKMGVPPDRLQATVERFNGFARAGRDPDFHRGESAYDRFYADPLQTPNPCLGPIEKPPYLAFKLVPGDIGTKGGLLTDEHARVLREDGSVVPGLYAAGNTSSSVMGHDYPGPGSTLGAAVTFAYVAAEHVAQHRRPTPA